MKNPTKRGAAAKFRGFYTALAISLVMIGAACFFAYRQTSSTLEENLSSITEQMEFPSTSSTAVSEAPVAGVKTDVEKETLPATQAPTEAPTAAPTEPPTEVEPPEDEIPEEETPSHSLVPPLTEYEILNPFSNGELVKSETTGTWQTHNGVDLGCETGADVFSIDTGTVTEVSNDALWGYTITIDHNNGVVSRYCGLDGSVEVREGDIVQSGEKIGIVGNTADIESALAPHLHLEVKKNSEYIDPAFYFGS